MSERFFVELYDVTDEYRANARTEFYVWLYRAVFVLLFTLPLLFTEPRDSVAWKYLSSPLLIVLVAFLTKVMSNNQNSDGVVREIQMQGRVIKKIDIYGIGRAAGEVGVFDKLREIEQLHVIDEQTKIFVHGRFLYVRRNWPWCQDIKIAPEEFVDRDAYLEFLAFCEEQGAKIHRSAREVIA